MLACAVALVPIATSGVGPRDIGQAAAEQPEALRGVGIDQRLNEQVPLDLVFRDETGQPVALRSLFRGRPVILSLAYYKCPMLCTLVLNGLVSAMKALPFDAGKEFDVITVSFNPEETSALAAEKKASYLAWAPSTDGTSSPEMRERSSSSPRRSASTTATTPSARSSRTRRASRC
jgi:protein SCO1/2